MNLILAVLTESLLYLTVLPWCAYTPMMKKSRFFTAKNLLLKVMQKDERLSYKKRIFSTAKGLVILAAANTHLKPNPYCARIIAFIKHERCAVWIDLDLT